MYDELYFDIPSDPDEVIEGEGCAHSLREERESDIRADLLNENTKTLLLHEIMNLLLNDAEKVRSVTCLSLSASILLLQHCKWLAEVAKEVYFENTEKTLCNLKLTEETAYNEPTFIINGESVECLICADEAKPNEAVGLSGCKHFFHKECWKSFTLYMLDSNEKEWNFRCPMDGCLHLIGVQTLKELFSGEDNVHLRLKIERHFLSNYIDASPRLCWCPNEKGCEGIVYTPKALHSRESVQCNVCGLHFCFHCKNMPHSPAFCDQVQQWVEKLDEDVPNIAYVLIYTKPCPSCHIRIQKNMGCNHMTCTCGHEFCWICMGKWTSHSGNYFSCNNAMQNVEQNRDGKQNEPIRFLKYCNKYMIQKDSSKKESTEIDRLASRTLDFAQAQANSCVFSSNPDFLVHLLENVKDTLKIAREYIAFAAVRCYYSDSEQHETQLFLFRTGSLEEATESLSYHLSMLKDDVSSNVKALQEGVAMVRRWISILEE